MLPILRPFKKNPSGFTLIELLIALFISAIIFTIMVYGLKTMINNYIALEKYRQGFIQLQTGMLEIDRDFVNFMPRDITDQARQTLPALTGNQTSIEFTTARQTLLRRAYFLDNQNLTQRTWLVLDRGKANEYKDRVLIRHVSEFSLSYLTAQRQMLNSWAPNLQIPSDPMNAASVKPEDKYPLAVIINLNIINKGKISRFFLVRKNLS